MKNYSERMHNAARWLVAYNECLTAKRAVRVVGRVAVKAGPAA